MSIWFRVSQIRETDAVFSGEGGLYAAGRWNLKGTKAIYCSQSIALCTLEWLSHNGLSVTGFSYFKFSINIPEKWIKQCVISDLPQSWRDTPSPVQNQEFTNTHFFGPKQFLAMRVPSVMVPEEHNLIINPLHAAFDEVKKSISFLGQYFAPKR